MNTELQNEIIGRLQKGESIENIAQEFSDIINQANVQYEIDQKAKEEKKAVKQKKITALKNFAEATAEVCRVWGLQKEANVIIKEITTQDIEEMVDEVDETLPLVSQYLSMFKPLMEFKIKPKEKEDTADKAIDNFLNMFVR